MVHMRVVRQFVHHDHLHHVERHPAPTLALEDQLDDLAIVEIAANELWIGFVFLQRGHREIVILHDGETLGGDRTQKSVGEVVGSLF